jgi:hypothetical protein
MKQKMQTPYAFTAAGLLIYYLVLATMLALMLVRNDQNFWAYFGFIAQYEIGSHVSNFALSTLFLFTAGALNMLTKASWRYILSAALILAIANFIAEIFVTALNTKDIVDAIYGVAGVIFALGLLPFMQKYGIRRNSVHSHQEPKRNR